jgi:hypothetical protein
MKTLSGKINWVEFDFSFTGAHFPKKDETSFVSTKISNVIIDENMIKFNTEPWDVGKGCDSVIYHVSLVISDDGKKFDGIFNEEDDCSEVKCTCELFENKSSYFLFGKWTEYLFEDESESICTWWARIDKK